jgi:transcriptional regulator with XRE-family HTH domain
VVTKYGREPDPKRRIRQERGDRIRKARELRGMSVVELAEKCQVTVGAVSHWETGRFTPRPEMQVRIAKAVDVPWSFLFGLDGEAA